MITVIATGGTIASAASRREDPTMPRLGAHELVVSLGLDLPRVETLDLCCVMSSALTAEHLLRLSATIHELAMAGTSAVVVTQGTATLPETSYLVDLLLGASIPVAMTGAMRPATDLTPDGPANLRDAIIFADASAGRRRGVYVVVDGEIHHPRDVLKLNGASAAGFASPGFGALGVVDAGAVIVRRERPLRSRRFAGLERRVELVTATFDASTLLLEAVERSDTVGVVVSGFPGRGTVPPSWVAPIGRLVESGRVVVFAVPNLQGRVVPKDGGDGSARQLAELGVVMAGDLAPAKARCLLMAALYESMEAPKVDEIFRQELAEQ
jgi:L-asparaginase